MGSAAYFQVLKKSLSLRQNVDNEEFSRNISSLASSCSVGGISQWGAIGG
jgi:hypothetical protein